MTIIDDISGIRKDLGIRIRDKRKAEGLTQERLGLMVGLDRTYVLGVEHGRRNISIDNLIKISRGLDISLSQLLWDIDPENSDGNAEYAFVEIPPQ